MKTVFVHGGSTGIGAATVRRFVSEGYRVGFTYCASTEAAEALAKETGALAILADSADRNAIFMAVDRFSKVLGDPDILVNCAAVALSGLITDIPDEEYDRTVAVNLTAPYLYTRAFLPAMIKRKGGAIVNVVSMWGETGASCEVPYSMTKAGLIGFTKALAKEVGPSGITVNAVSPGVIDTKMNAAYTESDMNALREETPLMRIGTAEEVADAIFFLATDRARFITGEVLRVNGGFLI